ncbi:hypothetical protein HDU84_009512 [Entophlyctis sp. JEL0112]|nr:hypothetical protein HDU84_009512 [Entophlyctis sp. JEL0112]
MPVWSVSKQQLPQITQELARDRIADVIANAARAMASAPDELGPTNTTTETLICEQYLKVKESISKVQTAKETVKNEPAVTGKKPRSAKKSTEVRAEDDYWGFEDHSVPVLVSLARYKRNHEFINELFSATPYGTGSIFCGDVSDRSISEKQEEALHTKATMDEIHALEAEIKELEEQNKKLLSNTAVAMELQIAHNFRPKKKKTVHRDPYINMLETQSLLPIHDRSCTSKRQLSRLETACHILSDKTILLIVWFGLVVLIGLNCVIAATCFYSANPDARCILYAGVGASIAVAAIYLLALGIYVALALCSSNSGHIVSETHVY